MSTILDYLVRTVFNDKGVKDAKRSIESLDRTAEQSSKKQAEATKKQEGDWGRLKGAIGAAAAAYVSLEGARRAWQTASEGADLLRLEDQFGKLTESIGSSADMLGRLREATRGAVSDAELMRSATDIISLGLAGTEEDVARLSTVITGLGLNMQQVILTFANDSKMRLDALGLSVEDVDRRVEQLKAQNFEGDAFDQAVLLALEDRYRMLSNSAGDMALSIDQIEAAARNAGDTFKTAFAEGLADEFAEAAGGAADLGDSLQTVAEILGKLSSSVVGEIAAGFILAADQADRLKRILDGDTGAIIGAVLSNSRSSDAELGRQFLSGGGALMGRMMLSGNPLLSIVPTMGRNIERWTGWDVGAPLDAMRGGLSDAYALATYSRQYAPQWGRQVRQPGGGSRAGRTWDRPDSRFPTTPEGWRSWFGDDAFGFFAQGSQFGSTAPTIPLQPRLTIDRGSGRGGYSFGDSVPAEVLAAEIQADLQRELDRQGAMELRIAAVNLEIDRFEMAAGVTPETAAEELMARFQEKAIDLARGQESTRLFDAFVNAARQIAPELAEALDFQLDFADQIGEVEKLAEALWGLSADQAAAVFEQIAGGASTAADAIRGLADAVRQNRDDMPTGYDVQWDGGDPFGPGAQAGFQERRAVAVRMTADARSLDALADEVEGVEPTITAKIDADDGPLAAVFDSWNGRTLNWNVAVSGGSGTRSSPAGGPAEWSSGGWTGAGPLNEVAGVVHRGEVVIPSDVLRSGAGAVTRFVNDAMPGGLRGGGGPRITQNFYNQQAAAIGAAYVEHLRRAAL